MRVRAATRQVHLWAGLALSLLLLVLGLSGSALVYKEAYWRWVHPELRGEALEVSAVEHAAAFATVRAVFGEEVRSVKLPEPGVRAYHLYLQEGEAFLSVGDHELIDRWRPGERPMSFLFDLHAHLMAGDMGERVGGVTALLGAILVLTGMYLWWPARRRFGLGSLVPKSFTRRELLPSHRDVGMLLSPVLLILLLTGGGIVFYGAAGVVLNGLFGDAPPPTEAAPERPAESGSPAWAGAPSLAVVEAAFPDARLVFYYPPSSGNGVHGFRLKRTCEVHPNGRSYLYTDASGRVLKRTDACVSPPGQRALHSVYPLHAGKMDSATYKILVFVGGLALALVSATGALSYLAKLRTGARRRRRRRRTGASAS